MRGRTTMVIAAITLVALAGAVAWAIHRAQAQPAGPRPIVWDRETCAECHMMISDRHYAAQLQTQEGEVLDFDDPACLMTYVVHHHPRIQVIYFRQSQQDRWVDYHSVAFLHSVDSPMGHGYEAVDAGTPGSISFDQALGETESTKLTPKER